MVARLSSYRNCKSKGESKGESKSKAKGKGRKKESRDGMVRLPQGCKVAKGAL